MIGPIMSEDQRGITLMEMTVVTVLATIVMLGLTGFYLSSQFMWVDGSAKAMTQREGTLLIQTIRDSTHGAFWYDADPVAHQLSLYKRGELNAFYVFRWDPATEAILAGLPGSEERMLQSSVQRFDLAFVDSSIVELSALELSSATGQVITLRSRFALLNRGVVE